MHGSQWKNCQLWAGLFSYLQLSERTYNNISQKCMPESPTDQNFQHRLTSFSRYEVLDTRKHRNAHDYKDLLVTAGIKQIDVKLMSWSK